MKTLTPAMLAYLAGDVQTNATCWLVTRTDGKIFGFTDHDVSISVGGVVFDASTGYTTSAIEMSDGLAVNNLELTALFDSDIIIESDLEAGIWNYAAVSIFLVNYMDLTMGTVPLSGGVLGEVTINYGGFKVELRALSQIMQDPVGEVFQPNCRAFLGDSRCQIDLGPLTATGSVQSLVNPVSWNDSTLTQVGPTVSYTDAQGHTIPNVSPFVIPTVPPTGGAFVANTQVTDYSGNVQTEVSSGPGQGQYSVDSAGNYTFGAIDHGNERFIDYTYSIGYFAYGLVTFTSGLNAGYSEDVKAFAPGVVTLVLPMPFPIAPGDTYTIVAGCDRQFGTCKGRFNNIIHFRGEPYVPGLDTILRSLSS